MVSSIFLPAGEEPRGAFIVNLLSLQELTELTLGGARQMASFSQRNGIRPLTKSIQKESIDEELKNLLWSALTIGLWNYWSKGSDWNRRNVELVVQLLWLHHFKLPFDKLPFFDSGYPKSSLQFIRDEFYNGQWWETYDLLEFIIKAVQDDWNWKGDLKKSVNIFLQSENAAYRVVGDEILEISDEHELEAIETALDKGIHQTKEHLSRSLELLSDRKNPDYRNSIKESISAVEAACQALSSQPKATLGDCIKAIKKNGSVHPAFEQAILKLYGWTSDEGGIRHAISDDSNPPTYADAKFMLVACAAFVNFLWTKAAELGLQVPGLPN